MFIHASGELRAGIDFTTFRDIRMQNQSQGSNITALILKEGLYEDGCYKSYVTGTWHVCAKG